MARQVNPGSGTRALLQRLTAARPPRFALPDDLSSVDWTAWRDALRRALWDVLGVPSPDTAPGMAPGTAPGTAPPRATVVERVECDGYTREKVYIEGGFGSTVPCYVLVPHRIAAKAPALVCLHGHGGLAGSRHVVGLPTGPEMARADAAMNYDYARRFALRGYVTAAPDAHSFGERAAWDADGVASEQSWDRREHTTLGLVASYLGLTLSGLRLADDMCVTSYVAARPEVDAARVGCAGLSEGGKRAMFLAALDDRLSAAVVSGYFTALRDQVRDAEWDRLHGWDVCNQIHGLLAVADLPDVLALIAPRPLMIQVGTQDTLFGPKSVAAAYARLAAAYRAVGVPERLALDAFDGPHIFNPDPAQRWLDRWLKR